MAVSIRYRYALRFTYLFEPWFWPLVAQSLKGEARVREGLEWVDVCIRRNGQRHFDVFRCLPRSQWMNTEEGYREDVVMGYLDSVRGIGPQDGQGGKPPVDEKFGKAHPALWEFMTSHAYSDGEVRTPSIVTIFCEDNAVKMCLSERDRGLTLWATAATVQDAFKALEARLTSERPDWRKSRPRGKGGR